jgi:hypothetical protein
MISGSTRYRFNIYLILLLYKVTLDLVYILVVSPNYAYVGYTLSFSLYKYLISLALLAIMFQPIACLLTGISPSSLIILILNIAYFIPGCTVYALHGLPDKYFLFFSIYWSLLMVFHYHFVHFKIRFIERKMTWILFFISVLIIGLIGLVISGTYNGFKFHFGLMDVYVLRDYQSKLKLPTLIRYLYPLASTILPIAVVYFLTKKAYLWSIFLSIVQLLLFAFGGHKTILFTLFAAILIYFFYTEKKSIWILYTVLGLNIIVFVEALFLHGISYTNLFIQYRTFFMPNMISFKFFDFFSTHKLVYLSDSIFRWIGLKSPYSMPVPLLISGVYSGNYKAWANNGLCGDAFYQFGWLSLLIYPLLITIAVRVFEAVTKKLDIRIVFTSCILFAQAFINNTFFIVMLTNGFIFTCIFLYLMPRNTINERNLGN